MCPGRCLAGLDWLPGSAVSGHRFKARQALPCGRIGHRQPLRRRVGAGSAVQRQEWLCVLGLVRAMAPLRPRLDLIACRRRPGAGAVASGVRQASMSRPRLFSWNAILVMASKQWRACHEGYSQEGHEQGPSCFAPASPAPRLVGRYSAGGAASMPTGGGSREWTDWTSCHVGVSHDL